MFSEPFDNEIIVSEEFNNKINKIIDLYETKLVSHLDNVEKKS